eukprot:jgi/Mesvir1/5971/Mv00725-RA.1
MGASARMPTQPWNVRNKAVYDVGDMGVASGRCSRGNADAASLFHALCSAFLPQFLKVVPAKFACDLLNFVGPAALHGVLAFLSDENGKFSTGLFYALVLLLAPITQSFLLQGYFHRCFRVGSHVRAAVIASAYRKCLMLSAESRGATTHGELVNIIAVDAQRLGPEVFLYMHLVWSAPLQIVISLIMLYWVMGPAVIAGFLVMLLLMPINTALAYRESRINVSLMACKDDRLRAVNELLQGVRQIKFFAWEGTFMRRVAAAREKEMGELTSLQYLEAASQFLWSFTPVMVAAVSFGVMALDPSTPLTPERVFSAMALFNVLRFPLNMLPEITSTMVEAYVSIQRVQKLLLSSEVAGRRRRRSCCRQSSWRSSMSWRADGSSHSRGQRLSTGAAQEGNSHGEGAGGSSKGGRGRCGGVRGPRGGCGAVCPGDKGGRDKGRGDKGLVEMISVGRGAGASRVAVDPGSREEEEEEGDEGGEGGEGEKASLLKSQRPRPKGKFAGKHQRERRCHAAGEGEGHGAMIEAEEEGAEEGADDEEVMDQGGPVLYTNDGKPRHSLDILLSGQSFAWEAGGAPLLKDIWLEVRKGQLIALVGQVGSGKTSLLSALLGDMHLAPPASLRASNGRSWEACRDSNESHASTHDPNTDDDLFDPASHPMGDGGCTVVESIRGSVAYTSQSAWIMNCSLRDNVLFGMPWDAERYHQVLAACGLLHDIKFLPAGDLTEIGEKGINLSGGQKACLALARAVYSDHDVYLLDDPLSAMDAALGKHVFQRVIGPDGLLKGKTRVLATHQVQHLTAADLIVVLEDGHVKETGTYGALVAAGLDFAALAALEGGGSDTGHNNRGFGGSTESPDPSSVLLPLPSTVPEVVVNESSVCDSASAGRVHDQGFVGVGVSPPRLQRSSSAVLDQGMALAGNLVDLEYGGYDGSSRVRRRRSSEEVVAASLILAACVPGHHGSDRSGRGDKSRGGGGSTHGGGSEAAGMECLQEVGDRSKDSDVGVGSGGEEGVTASGVAGLSSAPQGKITAAQAGAVAVPTSGLQKDPEKGRSLEGGEGSCCERRQSADGPHEDASGEERKQATVTGGEPWRGSTVTGASGDKSHSLTGASEDYNCGDDDPAGAMARAGVGSEGKNRIDENGECNAGGNAITLAINSDNTSCCDAGGGGASGGELISEEDRVIGHVSANVYGSYLASMGPPVLLGALLAGLISQGFRIGLDSWMSFWSNGVKSALQQEGSARAAVCGGAIISNGSSSAAGDGGRAPVSLSAVVAGGWGDQGFVGGGDGMVSGTMLFVAIYVLLAFLTGLFAYFRSRLQARAGLAAAYVLHDKMLACVTRAPMAFFDTTPIGRILNRFSKDQDAVDTRLPTTMASFMNCLLQVGAVILVTMWVTPGVILPLVPMAFAYRRISGRYMVAIREVKRLESISVSPLLAHYAQSISGAPVIRAFGCVERFVEANLAHLERNMAAHLYISASNRWLSLRLETLGALVIFSATLYSVLLKGHISAGLAGLAITYSLLLTNTLSWMARMGTDVETSLSAVERLLAYTQVPPEAAVAVPEVDPPRDKWPTQGALSFQNVVFSYRPGLPPALNGFTCEIAGGEKIGVVGRAGAGKSSIAAALFRMVELSGGRIVLDGVDIACLGLHTLRSRMGTITQEPLLFCGSVRMNVDPLGLHGDAAIWDALARTGIRDRVVAIGGLDASVAEYGSNFSNGQRQMICLARALVRDMKVVVMDEATASIDLETDDLIRRTVREHMRSCTLVTIAHRLHTVLDSDRVLVMSGGRAAEVGTAHALLSRPGSLLSVLVEESGPRAAAKLRELARRTAMDKAGRPEQEVNQAGAQRRSAVNEAGRE